MTSKTPQEISKEYYSFVDRFIQSDFEDDKLLGKFYTDFSIAENMAEIVVRNYSIDHFLSTIRLIDPFCGDGRLIIKLAFSLWFWSSLYCLMFRTIYALSFSNIEIILISREDNVSKYSFSIIPSRLDLSKIDALNTREIKTVP